MLKKQSPTFSHDSLYIYSSIFAQVTTSHRNFQFPSLSPSSSTHYKHHRYSRYKMAQMLLLWWSKTTTKSVDIDTIATTRKMVENIGSTQNCFCGCLAKLLKKLKKRGRGIRAAAASRQSSFQCRYDPLSYSLNFDTSACGSMVDDEDYYHFCAFMSRFVAAPSRSSSTASSSSRILVATSPR